MVDIDPTDFEVEELPLPLKHGGFTMATRQGVKVTHIPTGTVAIYKGNRSQHVNRAIAVDMIVSALTHPRHRT